MTTLTVLTYNLHKGFSGDGRGNFVLERMRKQLRASAADIIFLQEAHGEHKHHAQRLSDWPDDAQFEYIADSIWPHYAYGKNAIYDHGHHGNAILSKFPFFRWDNVPLSPYPFAVSRSLLHGHIELPKTHEKIHLICVHLGFIGPERRAQSRRLREYVVDTIDDREPLIIAGDFNDWSGRGDRKFLRELALREAHRETFGHFARTFPARAPRLPLDRIYFRNIRLQSAERSSSAAWRELSDHTPIKASFWL